MAYGDFKDIPRRTDSDKVLRDKAFNFAKNSKYGEYQRGLAAMVYNFFDKKSPGASTTGGDVTCSPSETLATRDQSAIKGVIMPNQQLAEISHNSILTKFEKPNVYSLTL